MVRMVRRTKSELFDDEAGLDPNDAGGAQTDDQHLCKMMNDSPRKTAHGDDYGR